MAPPFTPDLALRRVLRLSRLNGWSVALFAGLCLLVSAVLLDPVGSFLAAVGVVSGVMEIRGGRRLRRRDPEGMTGLIRAQLVLLAVILVYCASRVFSFDAGYLRDQVIPEARRNLLLFGIDLDDFLKQGGLTVDGLIPYVRGFFWILYGAVAFVSCLYQGGLALYYRRRRPLVEQALAEAPFAAAAAAAGGEGQKFYDAVADEMARQQLKPGLWARALAESGGDPARAQAVYIRLRVADLQQGAAAL